MVAATAAECPCAIARTPPTVALSLRVAPEVVSKLSALTEALAASNHPGPWSRARAAALARLEAVAERVEEATP